MTHQVLWLQSALNELAEIWLKASPVLRKSITKAGRDIDAHLADRPGERGESRPHGRRVEFFPPLGVIYRGNEPMAAVAVIHVWCFRQGPK